MSVSGFDRDFPVRPGARPLYARPTGNLAAAMIGVVAVTVLGVAVLVLGPQIKTLFKGIIDGSNQIPESADKVKGLEASLKKTTDRLEELTKQQKLTTKRGTHTLRH